MLGLGAHGVQQDQWRARTAGQVAQPALAVATVPGRVQELGARARDRDRRFHQRLRAVAGEPSAWSSDGSPASDVGWAGRKANAIRAPAAATPAAT